MTLRSQLTLVGLGRLLALVVRRADGSRARVLPQGERWLAWKEDSQELVVLVPAAGPSSPAKGSVAMRHRTFHGKDPAAARPMVWPSSGGKRITLGLLESITYDATDIDSPSKGGARWIHQFGDRGERGHSQTRADAPSPYPDTLLPRLDADADGNLRIIRRKTNAFTVTDWIIA